MARHGLTLPGHPTSGADAPGGAEVPGGRRLAALRVRWAAIGAAVAVTLGAGGLSIGHAVLDAGERSVYVPVAPCRIIDTRPAPDTVGTRSTPLGPNENLLVRISGEPAGKCDTIPSDATGVAMNVTTIDGTQPSYLVVYPSNLTDPPIASNLNWYRGAPPTPNKVDVRLSPAGSVKFYNSAGSVNVFADVVGYYRDHNHDDRYYTKAQVESLASGEYTCNAVDFMPVAVAGSHEGTVQRGPATVSTATSTTFACGIHLPLGARITALSAALVDNNGGPGVDTSCSLHRRINAGIATGAVANTASTTGASAQPQVVTGLPVVESRVTAETNFWIQCALAPSGTSIQGATVAYTVDAASL